MLLKLGLDSNYSLQAIVLILLQLLLGNQTQHLNCGKFGCKLPNSLDSSVIIECVYQETSASDRIRIAYTVVTNTLQNTPRERKKKQQRQSLGFLQKKKALHK